MIAVAKKVSQASPVAKQRVQICIPKDVAGYLGKQIVRRLSPKRAYRTLQVKR